MATTPAVDEWAWCLRSAARAPRLRGMREFAEATVTLPDGPYRGRRFKCERQPYTSLLFSAIDSGVYNTIAVTGPTQSGKSLAGYVIPTLYHACELNETVILGVPSLAMATDKWQRDLLPVLAASKYENLLPRAGAGSRGGTTELVTLRNGASLRFMSGGGGDKSRAGFTARVLVITEVDGMDTPGGKSREADKVTQLVARTRAFGAHRRVYLECTTTTEAGRIWSEYTAGTQSRIACPCPHCGEWVTPEREHLRGWTGAADVLAAAEAATFTCPDCGVAITEAARVEMNRRGKLVHNGQTINKRGVVAGDPPRTTTLGFRWSAFNNLLISARDIGADEWRAARATDEDNAEREMKQFVWARPHKPAALESVELSADALNVRTSGNPRGMVPEQSTRLTVGIDVGKWLLHYTAIAWSPDNRGHVVDYGRQEVASDAMPAERAILNALRELREQIARGYPQRGKAEPLHASGVWLDCGYKPDSVYAFCRESPKFYRPARGFGEGHRYMGRYTPRPKTGGTIRVVGENYHMRWDAVAGVLVVEINADHWKTIVHERFAMPAAQPGAIVLFDALPAEHLSYTKHLTAEQLVEEYNPRLGCTVKRWKELRRANHYLDATYICTACAHYVGVRLIAPTAPKPNAPGIIARLRMPDGRPFLITER